MKNIHVLPTEKPSELYINMQGILSKSNSLLLRLKSRHIYITSDEEIKEGDWVTNGLTIMRANLDGQPTMDDYHPWKKIILTTDQDLIKDGVQAIDDEFLEWFVKNPSCEEVEVIPYLKDIINPLTNEKYSNVQHRHFDKTKMIFTYHYKIIIPKEEPKFENSIENTINIMSMANSMFGKKDKQELSIRLKNSLKQFNISLEEALKLEDWKLKNIGFSNRSILEINTLKEETKKKHKVLIVGDGLPKQETLEEAAERVLPDSKCFTNRDRFNFVEGAKWQQEQDKKMYSEEDLKHAFFSGCQSERQIKPRVKCWEEFIEQFKNK